MPLMFVLARSYNVILIKNSPNKKDVFVEFFTTKKNKTVIKSFKPRCMNKHPKRQALELTLKD
jgi:hypothetical protein